MRTAEQGVYIHNRYLVKKKKNKTKDLHACCQLLLATVSCTIFKLKHGIYTIYGYSKCFYPISNFNVFYSIIIYQTLNKNIIILFNGTYKCYIM